MVWICSVSVFLLFLFYSNCFLIRIIWIKKILWKIGCITLLLTFQLGYEQSFLNTSGWKTLFIQDETAKKSKMKSIIPKAWLLGITKIEIAIPIPIPIRNWDRDPDRNLKIIYDPIAIAIAAPAIAYLLKMFMQECYV